ncbi:pepsin/retropepsin-like aspartic protease family protein [Haloferula helveola]
MKSLPLLAALALLPVAFAETRIAFQPVPVHSTDKSNLFVIDVETEGRPARFLLDTGCAYSLAYDTGFIKSLGKELEETGEARGAGGKATRYSAAISKTVIGGRIELGSQPKATVIPVDHLDHLTVGGEPADISGLMGSSLLRKVRAVFDYGGSRLLLPSTDAPAGTYTTAMKQQGATVVPLEEGRFGFPYVVLELEGKEFAFLLDTGANANIIEPAIAEELELEAVDGTSTVRGMHKTGGVPKFRAEDVGLGDAFVLDKLVFTAMATQAGLQEDDGPRLGGVFGTPVLKQLNARIDFDSNTLILPAKE